MRKIVLIFFYFACVIVASCNESKTDLKATSNGEPKDVSDKPEIKKEESKPFSKALNITNKESKTKILNDLNDLRLNGKVLILKQEEFFPGKELDEIGFKTGENSFVYKFNDAGNKIYDTSIDSLGNIKEISKYHFLDNGNKSSKDIYDMDDNPINKYEYEYGEFDRIIKYNIKDYINKIDYYSTAKYDTTGNMTSYSTFTQNGTKVQSAEYIYANGLKVKLILKDNFDSPYSICIYDYNNFEDVVKEIYYTGNNLPYSEYHIEYKYDAENNWIMKKYFLVKKYMNSSGDINKRIGLQTITMRTITYK